MLHQQKVDQTTRNYEYFHAGTKVDLFFPILPCYRQKKGKKRETAPPLQATKAPPQPDPRSPRHNFCSGITAGPPQPTPGAWVRAWGSGCPCIRLCGDPATSAKISPSTTPTDSPSAHPQSDSTAAFQGFPCRASDPTEGPRRQGHYYGRNLSQRMHMLKHSPTPPPSHPQPSAIQLALAPFEAFAISSSSSAKSMHSNTSYT